MIVPAVVEAIKKSWGADTCFPGSWDANRPETGQCAVTALVIFKTLGGKIMRSGLVTSKMEPRGSHYWNVLPNGYEIDITRSQFDAPVEFILVSESSEEHLLGNEDTKRRFEILLSRVESK